MKTEIVKYKGQDILIDNEELLKDETPEYLTRDEVYSILSEIPPDQKRNFMLINFLWKTGLRVSEAIFVKRGDIDFVMKNMRVIWLKRRKKTVRTVPINDKFAYELSLYSSGMNKNEKLFNISRQRAYQIVKKCASYSNVTKKVHPHVFRHSFAVHYLKKTNDIVGLKMLLGHISIINTLVYTKIVNSDLREKLNGVEF